MENKEMIEDFKSVLEIITKVKNKYNLNYVSAFMFNETKSGCFSYSEDGKDIGSVFYEEEKNE